MAVTAKEMAEALRTLYANLKEMRAACQPPHTDPRAADRLELAWVESIVIVYRIVERMDSEGWEGQDQTQ